MSELYREATEQEVRASLAGNRYDVQIMWVVPVQPPAPGAYLQWVIPGEVPDYAPVTWGEVTDDE